MTRHLATLRESKVTAAVYTRLCEFFALSFRALNRTHFDESVCVCVCVVCGGLCDVLCVLSCVVYVVCLLRCCVSCKGVSCLSATWCGACGMVFDGCFLFSFYSLLFSSCNITQFGRARQRCKINGNGGCSATKFPKTLRRD